MVIKFLIRDCFVSDLITYDRFTCAALLKGGERRRRRDVNGNLVEIHWLVHDNSMTRVARRIRCVVRCGIRRMHECDNSLLISLLNTVHKDRAFWKLFRTRASDYHFVNGVWESTRIAKYKTKSKETGISVPDLYFSDTFWYLGEAYRKELRSNYVLEFPS